MTIYNVYRTQFEIIKKPREIIIVNPKKSNDIIKKNTFKSTDHFNVSMETLSFLNNLYFIN